MFKLSKLSLLILGIGVMIVAFVALYLAYSQFGSQRDTLFITIDTLQKRYAQASADKRTLEPQLSQLQQKTADLQAAYDKARGQFPVDATQSIEYDEELSGLADDAGVTVSSLAAGENIRLVEGNLTYTTTDFTADVSGDRANILEFLHRVALSNYFTTATIDAVDLLSEATPTPSPTPGAPEVPPPVNYSSMTLTITVYRYEGN